MYHLDLSIESFGLVEPSLEKSLRVDIGRIYQTTIKIEFAFLYLSLFTFMELVKQGKFNSSKTPKSKGIGGCGGVNWVLNTFYKTPLIKQIIDQIKRIKKKDYKLNVIVVR